MTQTEAPPKYYKELPLKEKLALFKEFFYILDPRHALWLNIAGFAMLLATAGASFVYILSKNWIITLIYLLLYEVYVITYGIILVYKLIKRNKRFFEWLKNDKNILKKRRRH